MTRTLRWILLASTLAAAAACAHAPPKNDEVTASMSPADERALGPDAGSAVAPPPVAPVTPADP